MRTIKRLVHTIWIFFLFMGCTLLFYYGILWVSGEYEEYHRYDEPKGKSVKVFNPSHVDGDSTLFRKRLRLFIVEGE